jgi:4-amino-4-deoxy-L-arabinose transferase-like glycosyltransferase
MTRRTGALLLAIAATAVALRLWGITFGLPYDLTADEPHQIVQALKVGTGAGGPLVRMWHTIGKGGLDYLLFFEYGLLYAWWWLVGRVSAPQDFALQYLVDPTAFYLVGRATVAVLGAMTAVAVFAAGRRMYDARVGLGAALLAAVGYYHTAASHTINVHIPMAFALWSGVAAFLAYEASGRRRWLIASGLLCGAAMALAYSAAIGLLMLLAALLLPSGREHWSNRLTGAAWLCGAAILSIALMSPDLLTGAAALLRNFASPDTATLQSGDLRGAIDSVTIIRQREWVGYLQLLLKPYNVIATLAAVAGVLAGIWRRERWTILLSAMTLAFLLIVSSASRGLSESYLLPVTPALWLLGSRGIAALSFNRRSLYAAGLVAATGVSLFFTVRENVMLWTPDTRVLAKQWIESHVPPGSKILMDGMRFRFVQGVPLNGDRATVERRLAALETSELTLSDQMLSLYREAATRIAGPTYDLHSTVYGLDVQDLDYYVRECFNYVVVSSFNEKRYAGEDDARRHPKSAQFYRDIKVDPRFRAVYTVDALMWQHVGPRITVYKVACDRTDGESARLN